MSTFDDMTRKAQNSPFIVLIFAVFLTLFVISLVLMYEDYNTSYLGYSLIPTNKANPNLGIWVALLPQAIQIALTYLGIEKKNPWYIIAAGLALLLDVSTDVYFKSYGGRTMSLVWIATIESLTLFTLGSELLFVLSGGVLWSLKDPLNRYITGRNKRRAVRNTPPHEDLRGF
jgi:hypothetical protein